MNNSRFGKNKKAKGPKSRHSNNINNSKTIIKINNNNYVNIANPNFNLLNKEDVKNFISDHISKNNIKFKNNENISNLNDLDDKNCIIF